MLTKTSGNCGVFALEKVLMYQEKPQTGRRVAIIARYLSVLFDMTEIQQRSRSREIYRDGICIIYLAAVKQWVWLALSGNTV